MREYNAWAVRNGAGVLEARPPAFDRRLHVSDQGLSCLGDKASSQESQVVKFTIITACRNSAPYLPETIRSVVEQSALRQGIATLEYFIIDGASTDGTAEVVSRYRHASMTFISEPDTGLYDAVVKGFSRATGDVVAYLNAGDILHEHAFRIAAEDAARRSGVDLRIPTQSMKTAR